MFILENCTICTSIKYIFIIIFLYIIIILYSLFCFLEEDIDSVSRELQKYEIQMPAFQKIGGLLANSIATNAATLHAAVFAVNQAVTDKVLNLFV